MNDDFNLSRFPQKYSKEGSEYPDVEIQDNVPGLDEGQVKVSDKEANDVFYLEEDEVTDFVQENDWSPYDS